MSLTCIVIDDHILAAEHIAGYAKRAGLEVVAIETDSSVALAHIQEMKIKPDVVFLDISMPGMDGLEMAKELMDITAIVFTTAHRDYAAESYQLNAVYYLVKPITYDDFKKSIDKVFATKKDQNQGTKEYTAIPGRGKGGIIRIKTAEIIYLKSAEHYVEIYTESKKYIVHRAMKTMLGELGGFPFVRVHKSFAVNVHWVTELKDNTIYLSNGTKIDLGSNYRNDFLKWI